MLDECPLTLTGADFSALVSDAMFAGIKRAIERGEVASPGAPARVALCAEDFLQAVKSIQPSVSAADLAVYEAQRHSLE